MALLTLPNELLVAIAAAGQPYEDRIVQRRYRCERTLSQVSRHLRDVIISAPTLWTLLELDLHNGEFTSLAQLYLTRSRACHVSVLLHEAKDIDNDDLIAERIRVLVPHLPRIKKMRLSLYVDPAVALSPLRHVPASNLERLEILNNIDPTNIDHTDFEIFTLGLPKLTFLSMKDVAPRLLGAPWAVALTHLQFHNYESSLAATFVTQFSSLIHLSVGMVDPTIGRLSMPSLQFLRISIADDQDADYLPAVFDIFDTPALTELMVNGTHVDQIIVLFKLASLPCSSFPALMSLTFANYADCCTVIDEVRHQISPPRLFPVLSSLSLISQCFTSIFVNGMFASTAPPWPLLKTLTVCPLERDTDVVSDALWNARTAKPRTLPRFKLSGSLLAGMSKHEKESDKESGMDMELFDPTEIMAAFY